MAQLMDAVVRDIESLGGLHKEAKWAAYGVALMLKHLLNTLRTPIPADEFIQDMKDLLLWLEKNANNPFKDDLQE